jgi:hypothetical protein
MKPIVSNEILLILSGKLTTFRLPCFAEGSFIDEASARIRSQFVVLVSFT